MEELNILEQKVVVLIEFVAKLNKEIGSLRLINESLEKELIELKAENAHILEDNECLAAKINNMISLSEVESKEFDELSQEKKYTKQIVGDLIKSIESLVDKENQL